jgi:CheY-like chemotaxis protein
VPAAEALVEGSQRALLVVTDLMRLMGRLQPRYGRRDCTVLFELSGHETRVAYRAADALDIVANWTPDVVLSDIGLPDQDGYELVRAFRKLERLNATTFVAITGYADDSDRKAALEAGFDAHMPKPADAGKLEQFLIKRRMKNRRPQ